MIKTVPDDSTSTASRFRSKSMTIMDATAVCLSGPEGFDADLYAEAKRFVREYALATARRYEIRKIVD